MPADTLQIIRKQARLLAQEARRTDPSIVKFYWFPADDEVRLVEVATNMQPSQDTAFEAYYFPAAPQHNMPLPSGVALIRQGEDRRLTPPKEWGNWETAVELTPEETE